MNTTIDEYLEKLSSKSPIPGGGGAAAIASAIGTATAQMVCNLSIGKKKLINYEEINLKTCHKLEKIMNDLKILSKKDEEVFKPLSEAYKIQAITEKEKKAKQKILEPLLDNAAKVPLEIMEKTYDAVCLIENVVNTTTKLAKSDIGVSIAILEAGLKSEILNVYINTNMLINSKKAETYNNKAEEMLNLGIEKCDKIYKAIKDSFKKE